MPYGLLAMNIMLYFINIVYMLSFQEFGVYDLDSGTYRVISTGYVSHDCVQIGKDGHVYCIAGSSTMFKAVLRINIETSKVLFMVSEQIPPGQ